MLTHKQAKRVRELLENRQDIVEANNVLSRHRAAAVALSIDIEGSPEDACLPTISHVEAVAVLATAQARVEAELRELGIEIATS